MTIPTGKLPRTRETTLRNECLKADSEFQKESLDVIEYEFPRRIFRGRYKRRGYYDTD